MPKRIPTNWWHRFTDWFWGMPLWISKYGHKVRSNEKNGPIYVWPNGNMYRDVNDWGPDIYTDAHIDEEQSEKMILQIDKKL